MDMYVSDEVINRMQEAQRRVLEGEPLAYVLQQWDFYSMTLHVDSHVLIPRDDTCALAEIAIRQALFLDSNPRILDLCTGSGCIGLAIASRVKDAKVTLADLSREALAVAKKNVALHHMGGRVSCVQADAMAEPPSFLGMFDMIVSNPPYIDENDMASLEVSVKDYEPHMALYGGTDGLDFYRSITEKYRHILKPGGYLCYEFGEEQGDDVCEILAANGFTVRQRVKDVCGTERAVIAQYCVEE
jgi:release factor glutamine methyltransferase